MMYISREKFKIGFLLVFTYVVLLCAYKLAIQREVTLLQNSNEAQKLPLLDAAIESSKTNQRGFPPSSADLAAEMNQNYQKEIGILRRSLHRVEKALEQLWCDTKDVMSRGGFCVSADKVFSGGNQLVDPELCYSIEALVGKASLADLGAGLGLYGMCFLRKNETQFRLKADQKKQYMDNIRASLGDMSAKPQIVHSWHGFDGAFNIDEVSGGFINYADLSEEGLWLGRHWDWVISIEVGEHIPSQYEDYFLDNLVRHACQGIVVTWAVEGQGGHHHVNNHNNDYIKKKMSDRGLINDIEAEKKLKGAVTLSYLKNTAMIFRFPNPKSCLEG